MDGWMDGQTLAFLELMLLTKSNRTRYSIFSSPLLSFDLFMHFTVDKSLIGCLNGIAIKVNFVEIDTTEE